MLTSVLLILLAKLVGELMIFYYLPPRVRCRVLSYPGTIAFVYLALNLWLSGTGVLAVTGALASFASSFIVLKLARYMWGYFDRDETGRRWFIHGKFQVTVP